MHRQWPWLLMENVCTKLPRQARLLRVELEKMTARVAEAQRTCETLDERRANAADFDDEIGADEAQEKLSLARKALEVRLRLFAQNVSAFAFARTGS